MRKYKRELSEEARILKKTLNKNLPFEKLQDIKEKISMSKQLDNFPLDNLLCKSIPFPIAKEFIIKYHYSHTMPSTTKLSLGYFYNEMLTCVIVYGYPIGRNVLNWLQVPRATCLELTRLCSLDNLPKNTESYCIGKSFKFLRKFFPHIKYLISYADPNHGHMGYIYQATNWLYVGEQRRLMKERRIFIDNIETHARTLNAKHGSNSYKVLREIYGNRLKVIGAFKNMYIYIV